VTDFLAFPPAGAVRGTVRAPSSKSATNRALLLAAIGADPVELLGPLDSDDTRTLSACLEAMGAQIAPTDRGVLVRGPLGRAPGRPIRLDAGASGTAARFLAAVAAAVPGDWRLDGEPRLRERPIAELVAALVSAGASVRYDARDGFLPLAIAGGTLRGGGTVAVDASRSSQFLSALLLAGAATEKGISVHPVSAVVSAPYVDATIETLNAFGHDARRRDDGSIEVRRGTGARPAAYAVPGDWSSALPFLVAVGIAGGEVEIEGLAWPTPDADARASEVLEQMGVVVRRDRGSVVARAQEGDLRTVSISARDFPDAVPSLAALAAHATGESRFRGVAHLRGKESDRLDAIVKLFAAAGIRASAGDDELVVAGPPRSVSGLMRLPTFGDHRIAMAAALISLSSAGALIENPGCVSKSYPRFFRDLETILVRG
jgi:3-phosphoshikimate 1-carboxyvinyltransferase